MIPDNVKKQIAAAAVHSVGSGIAWQKLFAKNKLRIGFMGGSVTQGFSVDHVMEGAYPAQTVQLLREQGMDAEAIVCAEAGMGSMQGNLLAEEHLLAGKPDLVFLEFAINETTLRPSVLSFESLLRKLLTQPEPPVVCLFIIRNVNDYNCESFMLPVAEHYHLPCVRLRTGLNAALEQGLLKWEDYADAESHPTEDGHRLLADCLLQLFAAVRNAPDEAPLPLPEPWLGAPYQNLRFVHPEAECAFVQTDAELISRYHPYFPAAWKLTDKHPHLEFRAECRTVLIFYETHHLPEYGTCRISVDGEPMNPPVLDSNSLYGWGNARFVAAHSAAEAAAHLIALERTSGSFFVLGFGICC
ncbi:MAG: SGNH/GDSL hydrolase family protein [Oscillospiraceae bacterium]|nr:SGNH/GDSL hydrolase family protein [Oscillospiraceae bacterium]